MVADDKDIKRWGEIAKRRNAILPLRFQIIKKDVAIVCGKCQSNFVRPLIIAQNDPVFVCPSCSARNYIPIDWNVIRVRKGRF